jgi:hypothetical protein
MTSLQDTVIRGPKRAIDVPILVKDLFALGLSYLRIARSFQIPWPGTIGISVYAELV